MSVCLGAEKGERRFEYKEGRERGEMGNLQRLLLQNGGAQCFVKRDNGGMNRGKAMPPDALFYRFVPTHC